MDDCLFCQIEKGLIPSTRVYEDEVVYAMMDIFPESEGHLLIIPRMHAENLFEVPNDTLMHLIKVSKQLAKAAKQALQADGIKIAQFNGAEAGQTVFHYHMHVVPAYAGKPFKRHAGEVADIEQLKRLAEKIKVAL